MGETVTSYKCPACLGPLHFSSETGRLECEYCGSSYTPEELAAQVQPQEQQAAQNAADAEHQETICYTGTPWENEDGSIQVYSCPSCGAELICDQATAATSCPYCGNPAIVPSQLTGALKPDFIIPFKLNQKDAETALRRHYRKKLLLPSVFSKENNIREIKGIYVPFWLFDARTNGSMTCAASNSSTHRSGNYRITDTKHYTLRRSGDLSFLMVPVDGSRRMPDQLMDSLEPYQYQELVPFSTAYLPGYFADKYDISSDDVMSRADLRCRNATKDLLSRTISGYDSVSITEENFETAYGHVHYALLPVWLLNTRWKDQNYLFAMNGQTGHFVGQLPIDPRKKKLLYWGSLTVITALLALFFSGFLGRLLIRLLEIIFS